MFVKETEAETTLAISRILNTNVVFIPEVVIHRTLKLKKI